MGGMEHAGSRRSAIRNYIGTLSALLNFARAQGLARGERRADASTCPRPSAARRFASSTSTRSTRSWTPRSRAYEAIDRALYLTAAMTGLRQGELIALRWRDVDWTAARVRVRQNYVLGEFGTPKSRRSTRSVPMADAVAGELDRLYKRAGEHADDDLVFADPFTRRAARQGRDPAALSQGAEGREARRGAPLPRPAPHVRHDEWPAPAWRCARFRSGWATATSRRRSATPTTRRARTRPSWSPRRSPWTLPSAQTLQRL